MESEKCAVTETPVKTPVRVLYLCHDGGLYGAEQSLLQLITHLDRAEVQAFVSIARSGPLAEVIQVIPGVTVLYHQRVSWVKHAQRQWFQRIGDVIALITNIIGRVPPLVATIKAHNIQIIHTNSVVSLEGALAAAWCRWTGTPVANVWHIRELFTTPNPRFQPVLGVWAMRCLIPKMATKIIGISQAVSSQFTANPLASIITIANPVALPLTETISTPMTVPHTFRLGFVGRLSPGKGLLTVIHALQHLKTLQHHSVELHLYGKFVDAQAETEILNAIQHCHVASQVVFHGFTNPGDIYDTIEALILPSTNEAFGRVLVEAMANGVLCLGSNAGAIPELVKLNETGWLFKADDASDCAHQLTQLLSQWREQPQTIENIRCKAKQHVLALCNPQHHAEAVTRVYQSIVAEGTNTLP